MKISRKKSSPVKSNLRVTDDLSLLSRKSAVLNQLTNTKLSPESISLKASLYCQSIRFLGEDESNVNENSPSLFSMGCGTIPIKKKIDSIEQINIDQGHPSNSQGQSILEGNILDEFERDKSHLLYDSNTQNKRSLSCQPFEDISEISGHGDMSYMVISPKKVRVEGHCQKGEDPTRNNRLSFHFLDIDPTTRHLQKKTDLTFSDIYSIDIPPVQKKLSFSLNNSLEFPPLNRLQSDIEIQTVVHTQSCGIQTEIIQDNNENELLDDLEEKIDIDDDLLCSSFSGNICLQVSETEEEMIKEIAYDSDQDLFTPDCVVLDEFVSQDISRNFDMDIQLESNFALDDCIETFTIPAHTTYSQEIQNQNPGIDNENESCSLSEISENDQNNSQISIASSVIQCTQRNTLSAPNLFGELAKKAKNSIKPQMPDYAQMELQELQMLGQQYGLKANGRQALIKRLIDIWKFQHKSKDKPDNEVNQKTFDREVLLCVIQSDQELYQKILCYEV